MPKSSIPNTTTQSIDTGARRNLTIEAIDYAFEPHLPAGVQALVLMVAVSAGTGDGTYFDIPNSLVTKIAHARSREMGTRDVERQEAGVRMVINAHIVHALGIPVQWEMTPETHPSFTRPKRRAIPKRLREIVMQRDNHRCRWCGEVNPLLLTIDHITPVARGGQNEPDNLQFLCRSCNSRKGVS